MTRKAEDLSQSIPASQIAGPAMKALGGPDNPMHGHENAISALISFLGKPADGQVVAKPVFRERRSP